MRGGFAAGRPWGQMVAGAAVALGFVAIAIVGSQPLWNSSGSVTPADRAVAPPSSSGAPAVAALVEGAVPGSDLLAARSAVRAGGSGAAVRVEQEPKVASAAARFMNGAVPLSRDDRAAWVSAFSEPAASKPITAFLDDWLTALAGSAEGGTGAPVPVTLSTLGFRSVAPSSTAPSGAHTVVLWQRVQQVRNSPSATPGVQTAYVLTRVTMSEVGGRLLVRSVEGAVPGPEPSPTSSAWYPAVPA